MINQSAFENKIELVPRIYSSYLKSLKNFQPSIIVAGIMETMPFIMKGMNYKGYFTKVEFDPEDRIFR
jgi:hypothetical protein